MKYGKNRSFLRNNNRKSGAIADEIDFNLRKIDHEIFNVANGVSEIANFKNLILITPSYGVGQLQRDWEAHRAELEAMDFSGKKLLL